MRPSRTYRPAAQRLPQSTRCGQRRQRPSREWSAGFGGCDRSCSARSGGRRRPQVPRPSWRTRWSVEVMRRIFIRMVRFWRSTWEVEISRSSGSPKTTCFYDLTMSAGCIAVRCAWCGCIPSPNCAKSAHYRAWIVRQFDPEAPSAHQATATPAAASTSASMCCRPGDWLRRPLKPTIPRTEIQPTPSKTSDTVNSW
jgi:hypothetical protein